MALRRKKVHADDQAEEHHDPVETPPALRANGPWDVSEKVPGADEPYVDLGPLIVRGHDDYAIQLPTEGDSEDIGSVVLVTADAALELRAFAATRSGGLWDDVRDDLIIEVERLGGQSEQISGPFGPELHIRVPVELPDGEEGFQPSRIVGIEGPRWLLRGTFLGDAGLNPSDEGVLMDALKNVIVARGDEPRIPREALLLTLPADAVMTSEQE
ncbi:DUF3710 domain-containing protein [Aeromicrobium sp. A1-2]|uniref:DUF3710 domain-containing protein n=1 Tax=Aeromicrobium sp. A1-2 TaxID=2107713 RepID=UPI000E4867AA|nr:DUF3710 domain-containing protein [Aeromicrobium sp. A1-2]AXT84820.1 DUF3710 domain-containing protein [Aeromicrobium sp. A1-2]